MAECVICADHLQGDIASVMCGHVFHLDCIKTWFSHKQQCPCCKLSPAHAAAQRKDKRFIKIFLNLEKESLTPLKKIREELEACDGDDSAKIAELTKGCLSLRQEKQSLQTKLDDQKTRFTALETHCADLQTQIVEHKNSVARAANLVNEERKKRTTLWSEAQKNQAELANCRKQIQAANVEIDAKEKEISRLRVHYTSDRFSEHLEQGGELDEFEDFKSCNTEERCIQLTKVMRWRETSYKKSQANEREMQKELQALRTKGRAAKAREQEMEKQISDLRRKCSKARKECEQAVARAEEAEARDALQGREGGHGGSSSVALNQREASSSSSSAQRDVHVDCSFGRELDGEGEAAGGRGVGGGGGGPAGSSTASDAQLAAELDRRFNGQESARAGAVTGGKAAEEGRERREGGGSGGMAHVGESGGEEQRSAGSRPGLAGLAAGRVGGARGPLLFGRRPTVGKTGSLIKARDENLNPSHDPDDPDRGGKYIRSGPDGKGGVVNVFVKSAASWGEQRPAAGQQGGVKRGRPASAAGLVQGKKSKGGGGGGEGEGGGGQHRVLLQRCVRAARAAVVLARAAARMRLASLQAAALARIPAPAAALGRRALSALSAL